MKSTINNLVTEQRNSKTVNIDQKSAIEIVSLINAEDRGVAEAIQAIVPDIAKAADLITEALKSGGRLFFIGAGTSGRLGILEASECPPTFGISHDTVQAIMAGGNEAIHKAVEGAEDDAEMGAEDVGKYGIGPQDVLIGICASGRTPYVIGAIKRAGEIGAKVIGLSNNPNSVMREFVLIMLEAVVGPEVVTGSTRMKAGSAQKMVLNMLTTTTFIQLGKVYDNLMVDMTPTNEKLVTRAKRLIQLATGAADAIVDQTFISSEGHVKTAIVMILARVDRERATLLLEQSNGYIRKALGQ
jgi:N-acetylmuramic acid 6-phosphate etherase